MALGDKASRGAVDGIHFLNHALPRLKMPLCLSEMTLHQKPRSSLPLSPTVRLPSFRKERTTDPSFAEG